MRIMLVEDHELTRSTIGRLLTALGHYCVEVESANAALALVSSESFEAILLDFELADVDGVQFVEELERLEVSTPIILCSGHSTEYLEKRVTSYPVHAILQKPFGLDDLRQAFSSLVESKKT